MFNEEPLKKEYINLEFIKKNNLLQTLHPANWFKAFLGNKVDKVCKYRTDLCTAYTNLKGLLSNISYKSQSYSKFKWFTSIKIIDFIGLIILNSLIPSMRFECKFKTQIEDPIVDNDLYARVFKENIERY